MGGVQALDVSSNALDWDRVVRLARFHRVQGLVWKALCGADVSVPAPAAERLNLDAGEIAAQNLLVSAECQSLLKEFENAGQSLLFLKGLTLGQIAYGNSALKSGIDIDILVGPNQSNEAGARLERLGYNLVLPAGTAGRQSLETWHLRRKESVWMKPGLSVHLDLHTRLPDNPRLIPNISVGSPSQMIDIGNGITLPTLADEEQFAYLTVHGASSAWFRLKWISDFAALLARRSSGEIEHLYRRSLQLGAGRGAAQALLLADFFFCPLPENRLLKAELAQDSGNQHLFNAALRQLGGRREPVEPVSTLFGTATIHWTQFLLLSDAGFKLSELLRQVRNASRL